MPAALLRSRGVSKSYGDRTVLEDVDIRVDRTTRLGLVGPNGSGKSTLMRILAGQEDPDRGSVERQGTVAYLPQTVAGPELELSARDLILRRTGLGAAEKRLDELSARLEDGDLGVVEAHAEALERWLALGGADAEVRTEIATVEAGLAPGLSVRQVSGLSGGQLARVGLAALLASRFDVVLLDEPTNHLDRDGLASLDRHLAERSGGVVIASHDREFLSQSCSEVVELTAVDGVARHYGGGWPAYERERRLARERQQAEHDQAVAANERAERAEREMRRRAAASAARVSRIAADGDKHAKEWVRSRADGAAARARKLGARALRQEVPPAPRRKRPLRLNLTAAERGGGAALELRAAVIRRDAWRIGPIDLTIRYGDRLLLDGPNGSGKSSVITALAGELPLEAGLRSAAPGTVTGVLSQGRSGFDGPGTVVERCRDLTGLGEGDARTLLAGVGLGPAIAPGQAVTMSPGEMTRAELAVLGSLRVTCLMLDEPTNHLDTDSLEILESALEDWPGALIVASHDLALRKGLRINRVMSLGPAGCRERKSDPQAAPGG